MKTSRLVLCGLATALLGASAALAAPGMGPRHGGPGMPPHAQKRFERIPDNAPEEIKNAYKEMRSLRKDLNLELRKDAPDAAKAMEMLKKSEELHLKVREWEVKQILEGNAPKPGFGFGFGRDGRPGPKPGPGGRPGPKHGPQFGHHGRCGCFVPPPPPAYPVWTPWGSWMMPQRPYGPRPMPGCGCMNGPKHGPRHDAPAPQPEVPQAEPEAAPEASGTPAPETAEEAK